MPLTGKQKRELKRQGQKLADDCVVGKAGLTDAFRAFVDVIFDRKELIKVRFADIEGVERKAFAAEAAAALDAECVAVIGRTILLYRAAEPEAPDHAEATGT